MMLPSLAKSGAATLAIGASQRRQALEVAFRPAIDLSDRSNRVRSQVPDRPPGEIEDQALDMLANLAPDGLKNGRRAKARRPCRDQAY